MMMQPPSYIPNNDGISMDHSAVASQEPESQLTNQTQSTQQSSQPASSLDAHLWGFLQPCSSTLTRIDFWKICPSCSIGRNRETNDVVLPGFKISSYLTYLCHA